MPRTSTKTKPVTPSTLSPNGVPAGDVLTLAEAAAYLRVSEVAVLRATRVDKLPGRVVGEEWRFLKSALQEWLKSPLPAGDRATLLAWAGAFKDDPFLDDIVKEIYQNRGRPMTEGSE